MTYNLVLIDNYDSFTYNLLHALLSVSGVSVDVFFNDKVDEQVLKKCDAVVLSPGPGLPSEAGSMPSIIQKYMHAKPMLGICLGHQAIAEANDAILYQSPILYHGIATPIHITAENDPLFVDLPKQFQAGRYHSWMVDAATLPLHFSIIAKDENDDIMALRHCTLPLVGLQFHPESILTPLGNKIIANWLKHEIFTLRSIKN
ncbi:MAG: aminodeoxychorismate/anthranilate synthase component II [Candidatus Competibacteraceae bacterium]|nr:aminodeoxychorismate/anthranilate synthase component II [Candidatus Competibacteraceae bacterium]